MNTMKKLKTGALAGLFALLPLSSQAGLFVVITDLNTLTDVHLAVDNVLNDNDPDNAFVTTIYTAADGSKFNITTNSGAPDVASLFDTQLNTTLAAGSYWQVGIFDDSYLLGYPSATFLTDTTPTVIENITATLYSFVDGQAVLSATNLTQGVQTSGLATVNLNPITFMGHIVTLQNNSSVVGKFSTDTITQAVPEPGLLGLFGLSLLGLGLARRSKKEVA